MTEQFKTQVFDKNNEQLFVETKADYVLGLNEKIENAVPLKKIKVNGQEITIDANKAVDITIAAAPVYTFEQAAEADTGFAATYQLKKDGVAVEGSKLNIVKDKYIGTPDLKTCETANTPIEGLKVGDKYLEFPIKNSSEKEYVSLDELFNVYQAGTGIVFDGKTIKVNTETIQAKITSTAKLDADLVDDSTSTNKFVTSSEKSTWNNKQDAIADLEAIRTGAGKGATAVQPSDLDNVLRFVKVAVSE